ncbi:MAG: putative terminase small subunit [Prokaryotic dsDNA virus sp.]|nr:MAG: putative terminase small subunit [Prokaryotic dsDNA virus sp.]|tara:strand:- start:10774 stop:11169 length:396 start_codon:yes stop_codon:yes gene_type:complete
MLAELVDWISEGRTLRAFARDRGVSYGAIYNWINADKDVSARIAHAREAGYEVIAEECLDIADTTPAISEDVQLAKMRIWTRTQLLAKWSPVRYGDKQHVTHANDKDQPITIITGVPQPRPHADVDISEFE